MTAGEHELRGYETFNRTKLECKYFLYSKYILA